MRVFLIAAKEKNPEAENIFGKLKYEQFDWAKVIFNKHNQRARDVLNNVSSNTVEFSCIWKKFDVAYIITRVKY